MALSFESAPSNHNAPVTATLDSTRRGTALKPSSKPVVPEEEAKKHNRAARILGDLSDNVELWLKDSTKKYLNHAADLGMICVSSAYFSQYGAPAGLAFATAAALVGGKPLAEAVGDYFRKTDKKAVG